MASARARELVAEILRDHGRTYAAEAGIRLADKPAPLYQLLVLVTVLSKPISAELGVAAARELFAAGYRTPKKMRAASWQQRVDALTRAHYRRYDESTSTRLADSAAWMQTTWHGDLRDLAAQAGGDAQKAATLLQDAPGIGPTAASIYLREAQTVSSWPRPYADDRVLDAAKDLGLPNTVRALTDLAGTDDLALLGAALIRATLA